MMKVCIEVGHACGTDARFKGVGERDVCMVVAELVRRGLVAAGVGAEVVDFPWLSNNEDLQRTVDYANGGGFDVGVSLHCDCAEDVGAHGGHVCYYAGSVRGRELAGCVARRLCKVMPGRAECVVGRPSRGYGGLKVLSGTVAWWCLCELGFLSNDVDRGKLVNDVRGIAEAIVGGVLEFLSK